MASHVIVHQIDPTAYAGAGINLIIEDLVKHAPPQDTFSLVGVDANGVHRLGRWLPITIGSRSARFMPVARPDPGNQRRRVPHTMRLLAGVVRHRPKLDADYVHAHRVEVGAFLSLMHPSQRLIQFIHGDIEEWRRQKLESFWRFLPRVFLAFERWSVRRAAASVLVSSRARDRLAAHSDRVFHSKLSWFDGEVFKPLPRVPHTGFRIGWAARVEPQKDPLLAVETFARLRAQAVPFTAWIAGQGTLSPAVREALDRHGLNDVVELTGLLELPAIADRLRASDAFLVTSWWEGLPRSALEALGAGVPVVATDAGELRSAIQQGVNGFVTEDRSPGTLSALLLRCREIEPGSEVAATVAGFEVRTVVREIYDLFPRISDHA